MAEDQKSKAGWLERRREKKREKAQRSAEGIAARRRDHAAREDRATEGWTPEPQSGP
jgi:hypothetical protein